MSTALALHGALAWLLGLLVGCQDGAATKPTLDTASSDLSTGGDADGDGFVDEALGGDDCDDSDPLLYPGSAVPAEDTWVVDLKTVDVVFLLDSTSSQVDDNAKFAQLFSQLRPTLEASTPDWQVAVIVDDDDGCSRTGVLTPTTPNVDARFQAAASTGNVSRYSESLLTLAALGVAQAAGGCNDGLVRDDSVLHLVFVSDEPDQSAEDRSVYVADILAAKDTEQDVLISAIVGDAPDGCGSADAGWGYIDAVEATGGVLGSICDEDWTPSLEDAADATHARGAGTRMALSAVPAPGSLSVSVDGAALPEGWWWSDGDAHVDFDLGMLTDGATVTAAYTTPTGCEGSE